MIERIEIKNFALIEHIDVEINSGFTAITGETGAGKSIFLNALGLVLGARADFGIIRKGQSKCTVEITCSNVSAKVREILGEEGLDDLPKLILRRELLDSGKSRAFVNDSPCNLTQLRNVAHAHIDLHGQSENIALSSKHYQLSMLDQMIGLEDDLSSYRKLFAQFSKIKKTLAIEKAAASALKAEEDYLSFLAGEFEHLDLDGEKFEEATEQLRLQENAAAILEALNSSEHILDGEGGILSQLKSAIQAIKSVQKFSPKIEELVSRLESVRIEGEDLVSEISLSASEMDFDEDQKAQNEAYVNEVNRLMFKHNCQSMDELIEIKSVTEEKLESINTSDDRLTELEKELAALLSKVQAEAEALHAKRSAKLSDVSMDLTTTVSQLGMPKAVFDLRLEKTEGFNEFGCSAFSIDFSANGPDHLKPINEVASGGEVARVMLAIKSILGQRTEIPVIIFDEIDTGVSGEVATKMGALMRRLGENFQVLSVTHLPGVAAKGHQHIRVEKHDSDTGVVSNLKYLSTEERVDELASMFSGDKRTDAARQSAKVLLEDV